MKIRYQVTNKSRNEWYAVMPDEISITLTKFKTYEEAQAYINGCEDGRLDIWRIPISSRQWDAYEKGFSSSQKMIAIRTT
jgi:hypothetical protein